MQKTCTLNSSSVALVACVKQGRLGARDRVLYRLFRVSNTKTTQANSPTALSSLTNTLPGYQTTPTEHYRKKWLNDTRSYTNSIALVEFE